MVLRLRWSLVSFCFNFSLPVGNPTQSAVNKFVAVRRTKLCGHYYNFINPHLVAHIQPVFQFIAAKAQQPLGDRVQLMGTATLQVRGEHGLHFAQVLGHAVQEVMKISHVHFGHVVVGAQFGLNSADVGARHVPLIQALHSVMTRAAARRRGHGWGSIRHQSLPNRETISSAVLAASTPLLPALVPARSMACSMVSTVSTPKATGTPVLSETWDKPLVHSPATYSK